MRETYGLTERKISTVYGFPRAFARAEAMRVHVSPDLIVWVMHGGGTQSF